MIAVLFVLIVFIKNVHRSGNSAHVPSDKLRAYAAAHLLDTPRTGRLAPRSLTCD